MTAMEPTGVSVEEMYNDSQESYEDFLAVLDRSLHPLPPDVLYEKFGSLNPTPGSLVLDAGCRHAVQACQLSLRFGCRVMGVDFVEANLREAQNHIANHRFQQKVQVFQGDIEHLPFDEAMFDFIWCRDVLSHIDDLYQAAESCARVLKSNGKMLILGMFKTDRLTVEEGRTLWPPLATVPENMSRAYFEQAFTAAGFSLLEADVLGSEWREYGEEKDSKMTSKQLLRIARMMRDRERLVAQFGEKQIASEWANCHWGIYQMLGKLSAVIYTLEKEELGRCRQLSPLMTTLSQRISGRQLGIHFLGTALGGHSVGSTDRRAATLL